MIAFMWRMTQSGFLLGFLLTVPFSSYAQSAKPDERSQIGVIVPERPDQTNTPELVPKGFLQWETGFVRQQDMSGDISTVNTLFNSSLVRYGCSDMLELRLQMDYAGERTEDRVGLSRIIGWNPLTVGAKTFLCDQNGIVPQSSFSLSLTLPFLGAKEFRPPHLGPSFLLLCENEISDRISLGYNLGVIWDGMNPDPTSLVTASLGITLVEGVDVFLEGYSYFAGISGPDHRADAGVSILVLNNLMVDASGGVGLNSRAPDSFVSLGFSWRFPK